MAAHFAEHGRAAIERVYNRSPETYLRVAGKLLPQRSAATEPLGAEDIEALAGLEQALRQRRQARQQNYGARSNTGRFISTGEPSPFETMVLAALQLAVEQPWAAEGATPRDVAEQLPVNVRDHAGGAVRNMLHRVSSRGLAQGCRGLWRPLVPAKNETQIVD